MEALRAYLAQIADLEQARRILSWDQQTYMPPGGAAARAEQLGTLSRIIHEMSTGEHLGKLLAAAEHDGEQDTRLLQVARRDYERARKLPADLVVEMTRTQALARQTWQQARAESNWPLFAPHVARIFELKRTAAEQYGYEEHPYDALLEDFEPGMTVAQVRPLFEELKAGLVPLVQAVAAHNGEDTTACLHQPFEHKRQLGFGIQLIQGLGFDTRRGRQDLTAHPFCTSFSPDDVRITTRVDPDFLSPALFGTLHETGHALYEQGIPSSLARTPLGRWASLGVHESQSRLWENLVGRSLPFWRRHYTTLQQTFPEQLGTTDLDTFYRAINAVRPSFIRVEADELTYNLHIFLRFDLELALLENRLRVEDLPAAWNQGMRDLLGITPPDDALGVLQDVHWAIGLVAYFPTYTIGNVLAVQVWEAAQRDRPALREQIGAGEYAGLLQWLREHIHCHGRMYRPNELIERSTGQPLAATPYLDYLRTKYGALYGIEVGLQAS